MRKEDRQRHVLHFSPKEDGQEQEQPQGFTRVSHSRVHGIALLEQELDEQRGHEPGPSDNARLLVPCSNLRRHRGTPQGIRTTDC